MPAATRRTRTCVVAIAVAIALSLVGASCVTYGSEQDGRGSDTIYSSQRMADGKQWTTENLNLGIVESYCHGDEELNCGRYGRLYTWESAQRGCLSLGDGWRLPTDDDWLQMANQNGGVYDGSDESGKTAYQALLIGGSSGFDAVFGGGRAGDGQYDDLEAHAFYWTATESGLATAWFYNFGRGARFLNRHRDGEKETALSVRCVRE